MAYLWVPMTKGQFKKPFFVNLKQLLLSFSINNT